MHRSGVAFVALMLASAAAAAGELGVNVYGLSYHFERERARAIGTDNEFNPGIGLRYRGDSAGRFQWYADAGVYRDSGRNAAKLAGAAVQWKATERLGLGAALVALHSRTYNRGRAFVTPLPVASYELGPATLNLAYIPRVGSLNSINTLGLWVTLWPQRW